MLISAFASTLVGMNLPGFYALILSQSFEYLIPVYPEQTLTIKGTVERKIDLLSIIIIVVEVNNKEGQTVAKGEIKVKLKS